MALSHTFALLLTLLPLVVACSFPILINTTNPLDPRSLGLPLVLNSFGNYLTPGPWPTTAPGVQPLRYCFTSAAEHAKLNPIVLAAINLWKPAMTPDSALDIIPDTGDRDKGPPCVCGEEGVRGDALNIADYTKEKVTAASVGWAPDAKGVTTKTWHELRFATVDTSFDATGQVIKVGDSDIVRMAHELRHALGLEHEHQRPDAAKFIEFDCTAFQTYSPMKKAIASGEAKGFQKGDTIEKACTDRSVALRLQWSEVEQRLPIIQAPNTLGAYVSSAKIDLESIMMYGSFDSHTINVDPNKWDDKGTGAVLKAFTEKKSKIPGKKGKKEYSRVSMAGKWPARYVKSVSEGDVAWVKAMYPKK